MNPQDATDAQTAANEAEPATRMHAISDETTDLVDLVLDYSRRRILTDDTPLDKPSTEAELTRLAGRTIAERGIGAARPCRSSSTCSHRRASRPTTRSTCRSSRPRRRRRRPRSTSSSRRARSTAARGSRAPARSTPRTRCSRGSPASSACPTSAGGVFVQGGTLGNLSALVAAREARARSAAECARTRRGSAPTRWKIVCSAEAHSSIASAARVMDVDVVPVTPADDGMLRGDDVRAALEEHGASVFAVVATAGSTNFGIVDDVASIAALKDDFDFWLHVDGAYGLAAMLSPLARDRFAGVEHADSVIVDPHKWLFAPFDACALIYRDPEAGRRAHTQHAEYLDTLTETSEWSPSDYAAHLTRRARGLPFWFSLATYGGAAYREAISHSISVAADIAREIESRDGLLARARPAALGRRVRARGLDEADYDRLVGSPARRAEGVRDAELARGPAQHALRDRQPQHDVRAAGRASSTRCDARSRGPGAGGARRSADDRSAVRGASACRCARPRGAWRACGHAVSLPAGRPLSRRPGRRTRMSEKRPLTGQNVVVTGAPGASARPRRWGSPPSVPASESSGGIQHGSRPPPPTSGSARPTTRSTPSRPTSRRRRRCADSPPTCWSAIRESTSSSTTWAGSGRTGTSPRTASS